MLEGTPFWTSGTMNLWVNNKPAKVYVPPSNPKQAYEILQSRLSKEGSIPIGIDHLPDNIIEANPILAKLDLLDVGNITKIEYADDTIKIVEAELTNPLIRSLYEAGELDMVSIVANSTTSECQRGTHDYIVDTTDITRVDIVEKGACKTCNIPKPTASDETVVYARYSINEPMEENIMAEDAITMEAIEELLDKKLKPIDERLTALEKGDADPKPQDKDEKLKAMEARIADLEKDQEASELKAAEAIVDMAIMAGKRTPAQRDAEVKLCAADTEAYKETIKNSEVIVKLDDRMSLLAGDSDDDNDPEPTPEEQNVTAVLNHFGDE